MRQIATAQKGSFNRQFAYTYAKRGQVLLCERWALEHPEVQSVSCHPGWTDTPAVNSAYSKFEKSLLEPMRTPWQGAECGSVCRVKVYLSSSRGAPVPEMPTGLPIEAAGAGSTPGLTPPDSTAPAQASLAPLPAETSPARPPPALRFVRPRCCDGIAAPRPCARSRAPAQLLIAP